MNNNCYSVAEPQSGRVFKEILRNKLSLTWAWPEFLSVHGSYSKYWTGGPDLSSFICPYNAREGQLEASVQVEGPQFKYICIKRLKIPTATFKRYRVFLCCCIGSLSEMIMKQWIKCCTIMLSTWYIHPRFLPAWEGSLVQRPCYEAPKMIAFQITAKKLEASWLLAG